MSLVRSAVSGRPVIYGTAALVSLAALFLLLAGVVLASHSPPATIYVDDDCTGTRDGSVGNPFCSIQDAVDHAVAGDTIQVAPGTYATDTPLMIDKADLTLRSNSTAGTIIEGLVGADPVILLDPTAANFTLGGAAE